MNSRRRIWIAMRLLPPEVVCTQYKGQYHALAKERTMLLRCKSLEPPMSQLGQSGKARTEPLLSGLPSIADIQRYRRHVRSVPGADIAPSPLAISLPTLGALDSLGWP